MTITDAEAAELLAQATPGPWVARRGTRTDGLFIDGGENAYDEVLSTSVDCGHYCQGGTAVIEATAPDAALIAAAPDLAATVVELSAHRDRLAEDLTLANGVIAELEAERSALCATATAGILACEKLAALREAIDKVQANDDQLLAEVRGSQDSWDAGIAFDAWEKRRKALTQGGEGP